MKKAEQRQARINRIAKKLLVRFERQYEKADAHKKRRPMRLKERKRDRVKNMIAYDLETTNISSGTPQIKFITAYSAELKFNLALKVTTLEKLLHVLETYFLIEDFSGARFVAWNANNFDVYFISAALLHSNDYVLRPYMTKGKKIRGLQVTRKDNADSWEFLDGIAMTGLTGTPLKSFLKVFAPEYGKLDFDFENTEFDPDDPVHIEYAVRDSVGLYHGMIAAEQIVKQHFNISLQPTVGNLGIKIFASKMPANVSVFALPMRVQKIIQDNVMRGGYCHCVGKYHGAVWKYDINQAYAAAMREAFLPAGSVVKTTKIHPYAPCAIYRVTAINKSNFVPFYWKNSDGQATFTNTEINDGWITSIELKQLLAEKWHVHVHEGYFWNDQFKMTEYVNMLESLRNSGEGGSKGAQGVMIKAIGNNSYGKTVEQLEGVELVMSPECPVGYAAYQNDDEDFKHIWFRYVKPKLREYHQPHIGAFITAHVRMVLRRAIMLKPKAWLYADTDGVMFSEPVELDISPTVYGKWKVEAEGEIYRIITKKVYANNDASERHAKGVNIKPLTNEDFIKWFDGKPPIQTQLQRSNYVEVMTGADMFFERTKTGQKT